MFTISSDFIGDFKTGDNINYNLQVLRVLYECRSGVDNQERHYLRKPITIVLVSITEAMLRDFIDRVQLFTREGVRTLAGVIVKDIRTKTLDKLDHYIASAKKHRLLGEDETLYEQLDELRKLRNKIHIQGRGGQLEADESKAFSRTRMERAERILEYVGKYLSVNHRRPKDRRGWVRPFECPWNPHWDEVKKWREQRGARGPVTSDGPAWN